MSLAISTSSVALSASSPNLVQLVATGATGAVQWGLSNGSVLPGRLLFTPDGRFSGTPGVTGTFTVVVTALDLGPVSSQGSPGNQGPAISATVTLTIT